MKTFDIIGIVETWGNFKNEFDSFLTDYIHFSNVRSRNRHAIRNSGGVSVFIKETLFQSGFVQQIPTDFSDSIVLLLKTSLYENMNNDILFYITYISPEASTIYNNLHESNGILNLELNIETLREKYPNCYLYLAGDFNARTSDFLDFIPSDSLNYLYNIDIDYGEDNFEMPRQNKDPVINTFGGCLINMCCTLSIHIVNGRLFDDCIGNLTCTANRGCSVVDYHIVSTDLFPYFSDFRVEDYDLSDHFPVCAQLKFVDSTQTDDVGEITLNTTQQYDRYV